MTIDRVTAEGIARTGVAALQAGNGEAARTCFAQLVDGGHATVAMRSMLARACKLSGDRTGEAAALDAILAVDPANLGALLMRGDCYRRAGDARAAVSFFRSALDAASARSDVPPELGTDLVAARTFIEESARHFVDAIECALPEGGGSTRMRHAVDMLSGRREVFPQQPSVLYVPYLPQRQFYERDEFEWVPALEAATDAIRNELMALLEADAGFEPYVQPVDNRPHRDFHHLLNDPTWSAFYLWKDGERVEENLRRCPRTAEAMSRIPLSRIGSRTPSVLFSMLRPCAHIPPHHGMLNSRLICHLPLVVPPGCWLRVGNETRTPEEGKVLVFDDSISHEARNESAETRVILLFDIWRPELSADERQTVSTIFDAIDAMGGVPADR